MSNSILLWHPVVQNTVGPEHQMTPWGKENFGWDCLPLLTHAACSQGKIKQWKKNVENTVLKMRTCPRKSSANGPSCLDAIDMPYSTFANSSAGAGT